MKVLKVMLGVILLRIAMATDAGEATDPWASAFPIGARLPEIAAADQQGKQWDNSNLSGSHGLVVFFNRSTVW